MKKSVIHKVSKITLVIAVAFGMNYVFAESTTYETGIVIGSNQAPVPETIGIGNNINSLNGKKGSIAIGSDISLPNGAKAEAELNHIVIGQGATASNYAEGTRAAIVIGDHAKVENMVGKQERALAMNPSNYGFFTTVPLDAQKVASGIAMGRNTYSRTGSINIGSKVYEGDFYDIKGLDTNDSDKTRSESLGMLATTLGTNSYSNGPLSTNIGAYSAITSQYNGNNPDKAVQNFGSTVVGSLNGILSKSSNEKTAGIANSIIGVNNTLTNSNASIAIGAGNKISNSFKTISSPYSDFLPKNLKDFREGLDSSVNSEGGSTLALGGANKADWTRLSQLTGVKNTLTGTESKKSTNNLLNGYKNTGENVSYVTSIGSDNTLSNTNHVVILGDNRTVETGENSIILGSQDTKDMFKFSGKDIVAIGHNTHVTNESGIALGSGSISNRAAGMVGVEIDTQGNLHKKPDAENNLIWTATTSAVSVGFVKYDQDGKIVDPKNGEKYTTRQITGVAAGTYDTDAVNVAQLKAAIKAVSENAGGGSGDHTTIIASNEVANLPEQPTQSTGTTAPTEQSFTTDGYINVTPDASNTEEAKKKAQNYKIGVSKDTKKAVDNANAVIVNESSIVIDGQSKKITNIAAGEAKNDAVNVDQLNNATTTINNRINNLSHHVDRVDRHARAGIASAMAAGALPQAYLPGKSMIAGGVATYRSASAVAFGLSSVSDDGSRIYKLNASANTEGDAGVAAGVGFQW